MLKIKNIEVLPKKSVPDFRSDKDWAIIQIATGKDWPECSSERLIGCLQLSFPDDETTKFAHSKTILDFQNSQLIDLVGIFFVPVTARTERTRLSQKRLLHTYASLKGLSELTLTGVYNYLYCAPLEEPATSSAWAV